MMKKKVSKTDTLSFEKLVDWAEGRLSDEEGQIVSDQIALADEATCADLAWLDEFSQTSQMTVLLTPPLEIREVLARRFDAYTQGRRRPGFLQQLIAALSFDSNLQAGMAGVRGTNDQVSERQLVFTTDMADVAVNVHTDLYSHNVNVYGQVFSSRDVEPDDFTVQLINETKEVDITQPDDLGEFLFEDLVPGEYEMVFSTDQFEVLIPSVKL